MGLPVIQAVDDGPGFPPDVLPRVPAPLVSVAIPLWRSRPFVRQIARNIERLDYPNLEFLISDRHGHDDALQVLERRFGRDPRVRCLSSSDGVGWVDHYNDLLVAACGDYMMWLPHDDSVPPDYVSRLVSRLERRPEAALAFGRIVPIDLADAPLRYSFAPALFATRSAWAIRSSIELLFWGPAVPFRGVFRRRVVLDRGLQIRPTLGSIGADGYWVFGLSLVGVLLYDDRAFCWKRYHPRSASASCRPDASTTADGTRVLLSYVRDLTTRRTDRLLGSAGILAWSLVHGAHLTTCRLPPSARDAVRRTATRLAPAAITPGMRRH